MLLNHSFFLKQLSKNYFLIIDLVILEETDRLHSFAQQVILKTDVLERFYFE